MLNSSLYIMNCNTSTLFIRCRVYCRCISNDLQFSHLFELPHYLASVSGRSISLKLCEIEFSSSSFNHIPYSQANTADTSRDQIMNTIWDKETPIILMAYVKTNPTNTVLNGTAHSDKVKMVHRR